MSKIFFKFSLSLVLLINTIIFILFFPDLIYMVEDYLYPLFFLYFIVDSIGVMIPKLNDSIYSSKMQESRYIKVDNVDEKKLKKLIRFNNQRALLIFVLYAFGISLIGLSFHFLDWFDRKYIYLIFFGLNFADYFCIMLWCPFRIYFLKNSCCNTCRISNWDRIMKFSVLIFIPNIFTITIFVLGSLIFLYWEFQHYQHPERFYRISNQTLWCTNCDKITCGKKSINENKKE
jgi:hypothetical protein